MKTYVVGLMGVKHDMASVQVGLVTADNDDEALGKGIKLCKNVFPDYISHQVSYSELDGMLEHLNLFESIMGETK